jgi:hypothetical protein
METTKYTGKGILVKCKSYNNGEPLFFWERIFKPNSFFRFQKGVFYLMISDKDKIFVIDREHQAQEFDSKYFNYLFKIIGG